MEEPESWERTPVYCPRCENRWRSLERFYEETATHDSVYTSDRVQYIPDPPFDSLVALCVNPLEGIVEEARDAYNGTEGHEIHLHCGLCSLEMGWKDEVPSHNVALVTGAKHFDESDLFDKPV